MSASMNIEKAKEVAKEMTYSQAIYNVLKGKCVPYRKATKIKLKELLVIAKELDKIKE